MKNIALQTASQAGEHKLNVLREYLQNYILFLMQKAGMNLSLNFVGGTSLRFLYRIRRYSEDLDFSAAANWNPPKFSIYSTKLEAEIEKAGYSCGFFIKEEKTVQKLSIRFEDLLFELGLSPRKNQNLPINIEIDTNPPQGWKSERSIVDIHFPVLLQHYNKASLFAAKLTALFGRPYTKGRDVYDVFWFRSKWKNLIPNLELLNNGLAQVKALKNRVTLNEDNWLEVLKERIKDLDWKEVKRDIRPFLENPDEIITFNQDNMMLLLSA
ncbi:MAG: nucleotidyl transferase AbiEii/AbiGii toxin family protein [Candidatus Aminicenantes bacterium]|nr:nucleotidyl transferase AbiEii/AbiGii toxin family protein [Candidatus Aminicenantes bacterium]